MWLSLLDMQSQNGLPTLELALPHTEKEREGGKERPFDERTEPSPPLALFPSLPFSSLPCGVNLAKRRQHQPIYTSSSSIFFFCTVPSFTCLACASTPIHLSVLCVCTCLPMFVCTVSVILHALGGGISSTVRWKTVQPLRLATPVSYKLCS